jgi:hypothetical protein
MDIGGGGAGGTGGGATGGGTCSCDAVWPIVAAFWAAAAATACVAWVISPESPGLPTRIETARLQATHTETLSSAAGGGWAASPAQLQCQFQTQTAASVAPAGTEAGAGSAQFQLQFHVHSCGAVGGDICC